MWHPSPPSLSVPIPGTPPTLPPLPQIGPFSAVNRRLHGRERAYPPAFLHGRKGLHMQLQLPTNIDHMPSLPRGWQSLPSVVGPTHPYNSPSVWPPYARLLFGPHYNPHAVMQFACKPRIRGCPVRNRRPGDGCETPTEPGVRLPGSVLRTHCSTYRREAWGGREQAADAGWTTSYFGVLGRVSFLLPEMYTSCSLRVCPIFLGFSNYLLAHRLWERKG